MFLGGKFKFNGSYSREMYDAFLCHTGDNDGRDVGLIHSINKEASGTNGMFNYINTTRESITIPVEILFQRELTTVEKRNVINWLFPLDDQYKELEVEDTDLIYNVKFKNAKWVQYSTVSLIRAEIETDSAYGYTRLTVYDYDVVPDPLEVEIYNPSNAFEFYNPNISIQFKSDGELYITNKSLNQIMKVKGVTNEIVNINCTREVAVSSIKTYKYSDVENFIQLRYGRNVLIFSNVNADVTISCKYPMLFE